MGFVRETWRARAANMTAFNMSGRLATLNSMDHGIQTQLAAVNVDSVVNSASSVDTSIAGACVYGLGGTCAQLLLCASQLCVCA